MGRERVGKEGGALAGLLARHTRTRTRTGSRTVTGTHGRKRRRCHNQGVKLPGSLNEQGTRLAMGFREKLACWQNKEGKMSMRIQREAHSLERCVVVDLGGKTFVMMMELLTDRADVRQRRGAQRNVRRPSLFLMASERVFGQGAQIGGLTIRRDAGLSFPRFDGG